MTLRRLTEEFVGHFRDLRDKVGNSPFNLQRLSTTNPSYCAQIRELYLDWKVLEELKARMGQRDWPDVAQQFS
jgi:hypothetical protein